MKILKYAGLMLVLIVGAQLFISCSGAFIATGPPPMVNEVIVTAPSPRHVWVPGYYSYNSGSYVFVNGYYSVPPRGRTAYTQGSWQNTPKGYKRSRGYWH